MAKRRTLKVPVKWDEPHPDCQDERPFYQLLLDYWLYSFGTRGWTLGEDRPKGWKKYRNKFCKKYPEVSYTALERQVGPLRSTNKKQVNQGFARRNRTYWLEIGGKLPPPPSKVAAPECLDAGRITNAVKAINSVLSILTASEARQVHVAMRKWQDG
jgi:hypothetical protein